MASSYDALRLERPSHRDVFHLPALGAQVAEARRRLRTLLNDWGVDEDMCSDAGLVLSELFTNAVRHSDSEKIVCGLRLTPEALRLEVADEGRGATEPRTREATADEEGGRGLLLVGALARAWGVLPCTDGRGRVVWAVLGRGTAP
ncbi:ATP-binding protein [Streptomyces humicola]|uniref:ATP-binding protein n=1 Tax=Streptomyces humicola TaxID=2953240 RepID=UPI0027E24D23|nr:ATP-binding protein [Streptomyces humicola]